MVSIFPYFADLCWQDGFSKPVLNISNDFESQVNVTDGLNTPSRAGSRRQCRPADQLFKHSGSTSIHARPEFIHISIVDSVVDFFYAQSQFNRFEVDQITRKNIPSASGCFSVGLVQKPYPVLSARIPAKTVD